MCSTEGTSNLYVRSRARTLAEDQGPLVLLPPNEAVQQEPPLLSAARRRMGRSTRDDARSERMQKQVLGDDTWNTVGPGPTARTRCYGPFVVRTGSY